MELELRNKNEFTNTHWEEIIRNSIQIEEERSAPKKSSRCSNCCNDITDFISHIIFVGSCLSNFFMGIALIVVSVLQACEIKDFELHLQIVGGVMDLNAIVLGLIITFILCKKPNDSDGLCWITVLFVVGTSFCLVQIGVMIKTSILVFSKFDIKYFKINLREHYCYQKLQVTTMIGKTTYKIVIVS